MQSITSNERSSFWQRHKEVFQPILAILVQRFRDKRRHCEVDATFEDLKLLSRVGFFNYLKSLYQDVDVEIDNKNGKIHLRGKGDSYENSYETCVEALQNIHLIVERAFTLKSDEKWKWDIVADSSGQNYLESEMMSHDIKAEIRAGNSDDSIWVTALNEVQWQRARKLFDELLIEEILHIPSDAYISDSPDFQKFKRKQEEDNKALKIRFRREGDKKVIRIHLLGVKDNVMQAREATKNFIGLKREKTDHLTWKLSENKSKFLQKYFSDLVKPIEDDCKLSLTLDHKPGICTIRWTGLEEHFPRCITKLEELHKSILEKDETITLPGVDQLFSGKYGQQFFRLVQNGKKVEITIPPKSQRQTNQFLGSSGSVGAQNWFEEDFCHMQAVVVPRNTSCENVIVLLKHGNIEGERADVLAYSAPPNLNDNSVCGKVLKGVGGEPYINACKPYKDLSPGQIVHTEGGNLACRYVLHAVGFHWKKSKRNNEKVIRSFVNRILQTCTDLHVESLAISTAGARIYGYTEEDVFEIVYEEVEQICANNLAENSLKFVQIIYPKGKSLEKQNTDSSLSSRRKSASFRPRRRSTPQQAVEVTPGRPKRYCIRKCGSVNVVLMQEELTSPKADAIINILPNSNQSPSDNSTSTKILKAAGETVLEELNPHTKSSHPGSISTTSAGLIWNVKKILHMHPPSFDAPGLLSSLEQCLSFVQQLSLCRVLIPVAELVSPDVSLNSLVELILVAAESFGTEYSTAMEIVVLVSKRSEFYDLKMIFEGELQNVANRSTSGNSADHAQAKNYETNYEDRVSAVPNDDDEGVFVCQQRDETAFNVSQKDSSEGKSGQNSQIDGDNHAIIMGHVDRIVLHFTGIQSVVDNSISEVRAFVDSHTDKKEIKDENIFYFLQKHKTKVENLSAIYHVQIKYFQSGEITVEGVENNVFECHAKITELLSKYERSESVKRQIGNSEREKKSDVSDVSNEVDSNANFSNMSKECVDDGEEGGMKQTHNGSVRESPTTWTWNCKSKVHQEKFRKFYEYAQKHPEDIKEINGVRVCCMKEFSIGIGTDGTMVYIGLGKDGYEKAVKRLMKDISGSLAEHEKEILNESNTTASKYTVKYWYYDDKCDKEFAYLILDLCEETLEKYVERTSREELAPIAPDIMRQILEGLVDLHQKPKPILHRDLKPSNIMRDMQNRWLLADFGISRTLTDDKTVHRSGQKGTKFWRAVESYPLEGTSDETQVLYTKKSDIQAAGMVFFSIVTKGQHPFGLEEDRVSNLRHGNPVGLNDINDPSLKDLLTWMLSHKPEERPSAGEALKHPFLLPADQQFELLWKMGNQLEVKTISPSCEVVQQLNDDSKDWRALMDSKILKYLCIIPGKSKGNDYGSQWSECLRLIRNTNLHWKDRPFPQPEPFYLVGEPLRYFLTLYPNLPVMVHRILRSCDWKERAEFKYFFPQESVTQSQCKI